MVEIAKALGARSQLLILDEATSALTAADVDRSIACSSICKASGLSILYISHRMHEIEALADPCSVFRNGRHIETFAKGTRSRDEIVGLMIGREIEGQFPPKPERPRPPPLLEVRDLAWENRLNGVTLAAGRGEIVGLGGLDGQGQKELLLALFGVLRGVRGTVTVEGRNLRHVLARARQRAAALGMALVPEDRKTEGLMLLDVDRRQPRLASLGRLALGPFIDARRTREAVRTSHRAACRSRSAMRMIRSRPCRAATSRRW